MKYKPLDKVRIKSLDWYNENKDEDGNIPLVENTNSKYNFTKRMRGLCGKVMTISSANSYYYDMVEDNGEYFWADEMIEGLVKEETKPEPKFKVGDRVITNKGYIGKFEGWVSDYQVRVLFEESGCNVVIHPKDLKLMEEETLIERFDDNGLPFNEWLSHKGAFYIPDGYELKDENGNVINATKIVLEKKKKEYPKTYCECKNILGLWDIDDTERGYYKADLIDKLQMLLICRDAYWKIAGDEMGLGKPWEPDWDNVSDKYCIYFVSGNAWSKECQTRQCLFAFPTPEMRDAFKKNFDPDIEFCKELL